jgi:NDP-sugar pyrophosphorylase family protein
VKGDVTRNDADHHWQGGNRAHSRITILSHLLVTLSRARISSISIILNWNGEEIPDQVRKQMPAELQRLPPGRYVLDAIDEVPELTAEEEAGIHMAMESVRQARALV